MTEKIGEGKFTRETVGDVPFLVTTFPLGKDENVAEIVADARVATEEWQKEATPAGRALEVHFYENSLSGKTPDCESGKEVFMYVRLASEDIPDELLREAETLVEELAVVLSR